MIIKDKMPGLRFETKPIRGLITVQLFDAKTKKLIQKVEKENMVTNALKNMLQAYAATNQMGDIMPIATVGLGGVMLFDEELDADEDNVCFPMDAHLVGYGGQFIDTTNTMAGSKNEAESSVQLGENGRSRTVWDFGTSQANGTIKSIALTKNADPFRPLSNNVVAQPHYYSGNDRYTYNGNAVIAYEDGYAYVVHSITSSSERSGVYGDYTYTRTYSMTIRKTYCPMMNYKVGDPAQNYIYGPNDLHQTLTWTQVAHNADPAFNDCSAPCVDFDNDGNAYIVWSPGNSSGNGELYVTKIVRNNLEWTAQNCEILNLTGVQFLNDYHIVIDGHYFVVSYDRHSIYKINISNPQDIRQITLPEGYYVNSSQYWRTAAKGGRMYFTVYIDRAVGDRVQRCYRNAILYPDYTIVLQGIDQTYIMKHLWLPFDDGYVIGGQNSDGNSSYVYGRYTSNYLGTIANLQTPIVKNASQTLKVTYSLVDA